MSPLFRVQQVRPDDIGLLRQLNTLFAKAFRDPASYAGAPPADDYLEDLLGRSHVIVLVGVCGDTLVGGLVAYELPKLEQARSEIYIYDLAVDEDFRRQGVATRLIEELRTLARDRRAWVVYVQADQGDDAAIALYSKLGLREEVLHFDLPVP